jgi:16S rRNA (cytidine1402-2'-O)-methyltransferase
LGNPADVTARALEVLRRADLVAAEDTRTAGRLLATHGIRSRLVSYHDWNEEERAKRLIERLAGGTRVALISEAGTPGISDPGFDVVRLARQRGIPVFPVPGPSAFAAFLCASGLPTDAFSFFGFPPSRPAKRKAFFDSVAQRRETLVFYESPRRVVTALGDALSAFGDREAALAREMTKPHEEFLFGSLSELHRDLVARSRVLGEICWGVRGAPPGSEAARQGVEDALQAVRDLALPPRLAARELARRSGLGAKEAYALLAGLAGTGKPATGKP